MIKKISTSLFFLFLLEPSWSQMKMDVSKAEEILYSNPDSAILLIEKNLDKINNSNDTILKVQAANTYGVAVAMKGDNKKALSIFLVNEKLLGKSKFYSQRARVYGNIANVYAIISKFPKSLDYNLKALKIQIKLKDSSGISTTYNNIGNIYYLMSDFNNALDNYKISLKFMDTIHEKDLYSRSLANLAGLYQELNISDSSTIYTSKALRIFKMLKDYQSIAMLYNNISANLRDKGDIEGAIKKQQESIEMKKLMNDIGSLSTSYKVLGDLFLRQKNWSQAKVNCKKAEDLAIESNTLSNQRDACQCLYEAFSSSGKFSDALDYHIKYIKIRDSIINNENIKEITERKLNFDFERKQLSDSLKQVEKDIKKDFEQKKLDAQKELTIKQQKLYAIIGGLGFLLMLGIAFILLKANRQKKKVNEIILKQKNEVEHQKQIIEEKQKEIIDSINYAKRIQNAILPPQKLVDEILPNSFILYKPKDIVAGDFYWLEQKDNWVYFAAADCTGHGVPGAMVSVICNNGLNRSIKEYGLTEPGKILDKTREIIIEEFEKSDEDVKDGMDISLCALSVKELKLKWAGANNPLWILRASTGSATKEIIEIKPNKQPIGKYANPKLFTTHEIDINKDDILYIFTDGFQDQFGGEKQKKYRANNLKNLLIDITELSMNNQKNKLNSEFENWKGSLEQIDDVCIIGVRI